MQSPSPDAIYSSHIYISGDVVIHPSAAIAPGVLLQADPGCRLMLAAGVCVGQGAVLHACQGSLTIESGTTLGRGVLIVGQGQIGADVCIGAFTTVWNCSVAAGEILPPNSLIGETGPAPREPPPVPDPWTAEPAAFNPPDFKASFVGGFSSGFSGPRNSSNGNGSTPSPAQPAPVQPAPAQPAPAQPAPVHSSTPIPKPPTQVYGQAYVERIMIAMFPHRQLTQNQTDDSNSPNPP